MVLKNLVDNNFMGVAYILTYLFVALKTGYISKNTYTYSRYNNTCLKLLQLLYTEGLIDGFEINPSAKRVKIKLKYINNKPLISEFKLLSVPSNKNYLSANLVEIHKNKYDYFCIFTSNGLISSNNPIFEQSVQIGGQLLFGLKIGI